MTISSCESSSEGERVHRDEGLHLRMGSQKYDYMGMPCKYPVSQAITINNRKYLMHVKLCSIKYHVASLNCIFT